ncbi:MAG: hypothetical protein K6B70_01210 [Clostridia bacterium]|nr:hypothetical protein [Clostridia bacterium]
MSFQELCKKYKEEICPYCKNKNIDDCKICKTLDGVRCSGYIKDKEKIKQIKPLSFWVDPQIKRK